MFNKFIRDNSTAFWCFAAMVAVLQVCAIVSCSPANHYPVASYQQPAVMTTPVAAPVAVAPAPVVVQQHSNDGFFMGLMAGHLMSGGNNSAAPAAHTTVVNKTVTVNSAPAAPVAQAAPPAVPKPTYSAFSWGSKPAAPAVKPTVAPAPVIPKPAPYVPAAPKPVYSTAPKSYTYSAPKVTYSAPSYHSSPSPSGKR
jgi:hypothetical protein